MKIVGLIALLVSLALYLAQIFFYTRDQELLIYGALGVLWFSALLLNAFRMGATLSAALVSGFAAIGLGFVPHRLRLGGGFDFYVVLFPVIHFIATFVYLKSRKLE